MEISQTSLFMQIFIMLFFGVFVAWGGLTLGNGIRLWRARAPGSGASMRLGALIAGTILLTGSAVLSQANNWSATVLWVAFPILVLGSAFIPQQTLGELGAGTFIAIGLGVVVTTMSALVVREAFNHSDVLFGLLWGGCAGFVGLGFLSSGLMALLRGKTLALKQTDAGQYEIVPSEAANELEPSVAEPHRTQRHKRR